MIYSGTIFDGNQEPIPGSAIAFKTDSGQTVVTIPTDNMGRWSLDTNTDGGLFVPGIVAYFFAPGWGHYSIESNLLPATFNVTLQKQQLQPWVIAAIVSAVGLLLLLSKKKKGVGKIELDDVKTVVFMIGGLLGLAAVSKILKMLGLLNDPKDKELDAEAANPDSPWNPNFWNKGNPYAVPPFSEVTALTLSNIIYNEIGTFWDNEDKVIAAIHSLQSQAEVSFLAWKFNQTWNRDLLTWLRNGPGTMPWHGLSTAEVSNLNNFVYQLPKY